MTITTRTVAKGIPPRVHGPKPKGKPPAKKRYSKNTQGSRKRESRDSDDETGPEEDEGLSSDGSEVRKSKKKAGKRRRVEILDSDDVEMVENDDRPRKVIEDVDDDVDDDRVVPNEQEVSAFTYCMFR